MKKDIKKIEETVNKIKEAINAKNLRSLSDAIYREQVGSFKAKYNICETLAHITFSEEDITALKNFKFSPESFSTMNPHEKLLFCLVWKNGDMEKEQRIAEGLYADKKAERKVFYYFGLFLKTKSEADNGKIPYSEVTPIIDQHTMRAYLFIKDSIDFNEKEKILQENPQSQEEYYHRFDEYKEWYKETLKSCQGNEKENWYTLNKIFFIMGKLLLKIKHTN